MKSGTRVVVTFPNLMSPKTETGVVCRITAAMRPIPAGYVPVRFDADKARMLVPAELVVQA